MIKITWIKQKLAGLALIFMVALFINLGFEFEGEIGFMYLISLLIGLWFLRSKRRLFSHDYIFTFDMRKFVKG